MEVRLAWVRNRLVARGGSRKAVEREICKEWGIGVAQAKRYVQRVRDRMMFERMPADLPNAERNVAQSAERIRELGHSAEASGDLKTAVVAAKSDLDLALRHRAYMAAHSGGPEAAPEKLVSCAVLCIGEYAMLLSSAQRDALRQAIAVAETSEAK